MPAGAPAAEALVQAQFTTVEQQRAEGAVPLLEGTEDMHHPGSLQRQVRELQEELSHVRQQHLELRERMLALVHDQLNVLQTGRDHLTLNGSADAPQVR